MARSLYLIVFLALIYLATGDWRYVAGGVALLLLAGVLGYIAFDVVALRIDTWLNPWPEFDTRGFQIVQSLYAVAAGGVVGVLRPEPALPRPDRARVRPLAASGILEVIAQQVVGRLQRAADRRCGRRLPQRTKVHLRRPCGVSDRRAMGERDAVAADEVWLHRRAAGAGP